MNETILRERAMSLAEWTTGIRHALHRMPELGFEEVKTSAFVRRTLDALNIPYTHERTWTIATIRGELPGPIVGLRADIDALPLQEATGLPYSSEHPGRMHACGHDAHTAILLGTARLLDSLRAELPGTVRLFFQPAEETTGGAEPMIASGAMQGVRAVYALHVNAMAPVGFVSTRAGANHAACDELFIDVLGRKGHGAHPPSGVDAVVIAAQMISAMQTLVTRETEATDPVILTFGSIHGGTTNNILCDEVKLHGTLRTLSPEVRQQMHSRLTALCEGIAQAMNGDARVDIRPGYCACVNDAAEAARALATARRLFGDSMVKETQVSSMGAEDFAFFLREAPGAIYHLGCGSPAPLHNEAFRVDDACLPLGMLMHAAMVFGYLNEANKERTV